MYIEHNRILELVNYCGVSQASLGINIFFKEIKLIHFNLRFELEIRLFIESKKPQVSYLNCLYILV